MNISSNLPLVGFVVQTVIPVNGDTIEINPSSNSVALWLSPAGILDTLTVTVPPDNVSVLGQIVKIGSTQSIVSFTLNGAASILNTVTSFSAGDFFEFQKVDTDTWVRCS